jgi:hypothetical protein
MTIIVVGSAGRGLGVAATALCTEDETPGRTAAFTGRAGHRGRHT